MVADHDSPTDSTPYHLGCPPTRRTPPQPHRRSGKPSGGGGVEKQHGATIKPWVLRPAFSLSDWGEGQLLLKDESRLGRPHSVVLPVRRRRLPSSLWSSPPSDRSQWLRTPIWSQKDDFFPESYQTDDWGFSPPPEV